MLVGLDRVFIHNAFKFLHVTCSCIFHAYVISFLFWFMMCSTLSLSQIDSTMSPKACKSTPAQNPLHGSRSSSSDPPVPSHIWFRDEKAKTDFFENFQNRGVHP